MDPILERIFQLMKDQGVLDIQLQESIGISKGAISNWKRGRGNSYYQHIVAIADSLGVTEDYLLSGEELSYDSLTHGEIKLIEN